MAKYYYYFSGMEAAIRFLKTVPDDKREDVKVCFPVVDSNCLKKTSTDSINESLKQLIKGSDEPLTEERIKEIIAEINDLINAWPQIRVL